MDTKKEWNGDIELMGEFAARLYKATWEILKDDRLYYTPVNIDNGIAYTGSLPKPTLGGYVTWWSMCPWSRPEGGFLLHIAGSPMSGANGCVLVTAEGKLVYHYRAPAFWVLWTSMAPIMRRANRRPEGVESYETLADAIAALGLNA